MRPWIKATLDFSAPLVAESNGRKGHRASLGRLVLLAVSGIVVYKYAALSEVPPEGILTFAGMAFGYNGVKWFSKSAPKVEGSQQPSEQGPMQ